MNLQRSRVPGLIHKSDAKKIACEISVPTQPEHETENIRKCVAAGYEDVIAIAPEKKRLIELGKVFQTCLPSEDAARVHVCLPSRVSALLKKLMRGAKRSETASPRSGSYKIKRKYSDQSSTEEAQAAESEFLRIVGRALRGE